MRSLNEMLTIHEATTSVLRWGKAEWLVSVVDSKGNKIDTYLFQNRDELDTFLQNELGEYFDYAENGPSALDQIDNIDGQENGGCYQMCYDDSHNKYYVVSYITSY